jgi:hypothetical protein
VSALHHTIDSGAYTLLSQFEGKKKLLKIFHSQSLGVAIFKTARAVCDAPDRLYRHQIKKKKKIKLEHKIERREGRVEKKEDRGVKEKKKRKKGKTTTQKTDLGKRPKVKR